MTFNFSLLVLSARSITSSKILRVLLKRSLFGGEGSGDGDAETKRGELHSEDTGEDGDSVFDGRLCCWGKKRGDGESDISIVFTQP